MRSGRGGRVRWGDAKEGLGEGGGGHIGGFTFEKGESIPALRQPLSLSLSLSLSLVQSFCSLSMRKMKALRILLMMFVA